MDERAAPLFKFGVVNPTHFVVAVIHDAARADQAAAAPRDAGFTTDDVRVIPGQDVLNTEHTYHGTKVVLATLAGLFPSEERAAVEEYVAEAERGACFLVVKAPEQERRGLARGILAEHGGHAMRYYGDNTITDL